MGVWASRRPRHLGAAGLAIAGVVLLGGLSAQVTAAGLLAGLVTASAFAGYVLLQSRVGAADLPQLALALVVAGVVTLPFALPTAGDLSIGLVVRLAVSAAVGVAIAYSMDAFAIHRLGRRRAGILLSLDPAVGALVGLVVLGQRLEVVALLSIALVMAGGALAAAGDD